MANNPLTPTQRLLERLEGVKPAGERSFVALCPVHGDHTQSLSISEGDDGRVLVHCHAGCETADIVAAVGLTMRDLFPSKPKPPPPGSSDSVELADYHYHDANGGFISGVVRFRRPDGGKTFRPYRLDPRTGGRIWNTEGIKKVLYQLPEVLAAVKAGQPVYVCEGEKDCHTLRRFGLVATTNAGGAGKWRGEAGDRYAEALRSANVIVLPDNDEVGWRHAQDVARSLHGVAASIKIVELPGLPLKGDVSDWLSGGEPK